MTASKRECAWESLRISLALLAVGALVALAARACIFTITFRCLLSASVEVPRGL